MRKVFLLVVGVVFGTQLFAQSERVGSPDIPGDLIVNFGVNSLSGAPKSMKLNPLGSFSWGLYYSNRIGMGNMFAFYPGVGLGLEKYGFRKDVSLGFDEEQNVILDTISSLGVISKTNLAVNYIEIPAEIRFYPWKSTDGTGFFVGVGASIGFRFESHTKVKYEDSSGDNFQIKQRNDYNLSPFRAGVIGRVGTRSINAFYRMYFTELFDPGAGPEDISATAWTVGISFNGF